MQDNATLAGHGKKGELLPRSRGHSLQGSSKHSRVTMTLQGGESDPLAPWMASLLVQWFGSSILGILVLSYTCALGHSF